MHQPSTEPRASIYYQYKIYPFAGLEKLQQDVAKAQVCIIGAGPIGLATALDLARFGIRSVIIESERQLSHGSRAIVLTRRSMEILQMCGADQAFVEKGLPWDAGRSFYQGKEVYQMRLPKDEYARFAPALNIQQQYIEQFLVEQAEANELIEIHWGCHLTAVENHGDTCHFTVDSEAGTCQLLTPWLIAADGGKSTVRKLTGLRMEGQAYKGNFVIADIKVDIDLPTERLCYFDPPWNPGNNVLVHREPEGIWRLDFRLPDNETAEQALQPELLHQRIDAILAMIGDAVKSTSWELDWATVYTASTKTLPDYVEDNIIFVGDAAHLLPIFGVRGANTGLQDSNNVSWKLAYVIKGWAGKALLQSYSEERVQAAREICEEGGKSTRFMTPPSPGFRLLRDAVLSLSLRESFIKDLLHWRTSRPHIYQHSSLNYAGDSDLLGDVLPNYQLQKDLFLHDVLGSGFQLIVFAEAKAQLDVELEYASVRIIYVSSQADSSGVYGRDNFIISDKNQAMTKHFNLAEGSVVLVRPDQHICAVWRSLQVDEIQRALKLACKQEG